MTLLATYLLVLQSLVIGVGAAAPSSAGLFANSVCLSKSASPGGGPVAPGRSSHHSDLCCVVHCAGLGAAPAQDFANLAPPDFTLSAILLPEDQQDASSKAATPPLGSRAPPATV